MLPMCFITLLLHLSTVWGLQHSAMWGLNKATDGSGWGTLTFDVSDNATIMANYAAGMRALVPITWTEAQKKPCFAPVPHTRTTPSGYFGCITIAADYEELWKRQWQVIKPLAMSGAAIGIFLGDEHMYFGVELAHVKAIADLIRVDWPEAIIYMNEAPDIAMCNYRKDNSTVWKVDECLPVNVDWFGFDWYAHDSISWTGAAEAYETFVYPRLPRTDQRVVPTSLGYDGRQFASADYVAELDEFCAKNALEFFKLGLRDRRIVGQFPFHYNGGTMHKNGSVTGGIGIVNLPRCLQTYQGIGKIIAASAPGGTSGDIAHSPPTPDAHGQFVEPKCPSRLPAPPSAWANCKRT